MMMSMFSVFDPVSYFGLSVNWMALVLVFMVFPLSFFVCGGGLEIVKMMVVMELSGLFSEMSFPNYSGLVMLSVVLFLLISMMNVLGLFSFFFSCTGHVMVTLSMGAVVWVMGVLMGWMKNFSDSSAHLVPQGSPLILSPFMVVIEFVSHLIRPVTLSVRLAANMMSGHLIVGLISSVAMLGLGSFMISVVLQSVILILEWAVCFIQAFVFSVLVLLYSLDYY
uniref:ATP synthase F0 subunit 6 n=1 Tax=Brachypelma albiceps TaxID=1750704 RepID=UPI001FF6F251|nr:ATP synthase F0 subunit 6 [Brachypelma albiceps]UIO59246.1 ATP synthase F0 subunit 6 [Brachypelma albiceps]